MSNIEKIRQEIERRQEYHWKYLPDADSPEDDWTHNELCELGAFKELEHLEDFIDSLPEEKPSKDLEEAAEMAARNIYPYEGGTKGLICENSIPIYKAGFIAGAEWQKEQMMKEAEEGEIVKDISNKLAVTAKNVNLDGFKFGDKVKIIIVKKKEEET